VSAACRAAGRDRSEVTVIAVTKLFPASDISLLAELGMTDVGENRDQEAVGKHAQLAMLALRWHFVGRLQRNKARSVAAYADVVHSVDRGTLGVALSRAAQDAQRELPVLLQVSLDGPGAPDAAGRGGVNPAELGRLAEEVAALPALRLDGLMAVAPRTGDPERAFAELARLAQTLRQDHPAAATISAGMSGDLESAVRQGATHLRVGTALLGSRSHTVR
jgi:hypothetical protein